MTGEMYQPTWIRASLGEEVQHCQEKSFESCKLDEGGKQEKIQVKLDDGMECRGLMDREGLR